MAAMPKPLADQVIVLTGASSGIGLATARMAAEQGARVMLVARDDGSLREIVRSGELGRIYYVDAARLNLGLFQADINVLWDLAPHDLSILLYVLGEYPVPDVFAKVDMAAA